MQTRLITISPDLSDNDKKLFIDFIKQHPEMAFIEKSKTYIAVNGEAIQFAQNMIKTQATSPENQKFYIISNEREHELGKGAFSRARNITASIETSAENTLTHTVVTDKAVRIKNTQYAQQNRSLENPYSHAEAVTEYVIAQDFSHLSMEEPIEVTKAKPNLGKFSKSYSVMNKIPGEDFDTAGFDFVQYMQPTTQQLIDILILPTLEAYKKQMADRVHRDIKGENIHFDFWHSRTPPSTVNFLDVDSSKKIFDEAGHPSQEEDEPYGSPGYVAPELFSSPAPKVHPARDIFALGILLTGTINNDLEVTSYVTNIYGAENNGTAIILAHHELLAEMNGCYDSDLLMKNAIPSQPDYFEKLGYATEECFPLFHYLADESTPEALAAREQIIELLKQMTQIDPTKRPNIDTLIQRFKMISLNLEKPAPIVPAITIPTLSSTSMMQLALCSSSSSSSLDFSSPMRIETPRGSTPRDIYSPRDMEIANSPRSSSMSSSPCSSNSSPICSSSSSDTLDQMPPYTPTRSKLR